MGSIYVIIWGVGRSILWPYHVYRFGRFGDFFGGGMPSFIEPYLLHVIHGPSVSMAII